MEDTHTWQLYNGKENRKPQTSFILLLSLSFQLSFRSVSATVDTKREQVGSLKIEILKSKMFT